MTRTTLALAVFLTVALSVSATYAQRPVRVEEIARDRGGRLGVALRRELEQRHVVLGDGGAVVTGRLRGNGRQGVLEIVDGERHRTIPLRGTVPRMASDAAARIVSFVAQSEAPAAPTSSAGPDPGPLPEQNEQSAEAGSARQGPAAATVPRRSRPRESHALDDVAALRIWVGAELYTRQLRFVDDIFGQLGTFAIQPGVSLRGGFEWFPLRHLSRKLLAHLGVTGFARWLALSASGDGAGGQYGTRGHALELDLVYSLPIGGHSVTAGVGVGNELFAIEPARPATPAERAPRSPVPSVDYAYLRPYLACELKIIEELYLSAFAGFRALISTGDLAVRFPRSRGYGVDFGGAVAWRTSSFLELRVSAEHHRYVFDLRPEPGDPYIAGGMQDEWLVFSLDLVVRVPGASR